MNYFECCHHCVAPKRYPGCSGKCPEYAEARAKYDADKAAEMMSKHIHGYTAGLINASRNTEAIYKKNSNRYYRSDRHN